VKRSVQVTILGQEYALKTDLPAAKVEEIATFVNDQVGQIASHDRSSDTFRAVVLALLNVSGLYLHGDRKGAKAGHAADPETSHRLERLAERIAEALKDPQGTLNF